MKKSSSMVVFVVMFMFLVGSTFLGHARKTMAGTTNNNTRSRAPAQNVGADPSVSLESPPTPSPQKGEPFDPPLKLNGTFVQYWNDFMSWPTNLWEEEAKKLKEMKMDTIYIQYMRYGASRFYSDLKDFDPTDVILTFADNNNMKVYVGTQFNEDWWKKWDSESFLKDTLDEDLKFAKKLWKRYGKHKSFAGWYIPYEISDGDFDDSDIVILNGFIKNYVSGLKQISTSKTKVSLSAFFNHDLTNAQVETVFTQLLKNTKLDELMVQDGVGAHPEWKDKMSENVKPYYSAFQKACVKNKVQMIPVVEVFETEKHDNGNNNRIPAPQKRIKDQLLVSQSMGFSNNIAFDAFHYMSPGRGDAQKKAFDQYVQECAQDERGCRF